MIQSSLFDAPVPAPTPKAAPKASKFVPTPIWQGWAYTAEAVSMLRCPVCDERPEFRFEEGRLICESGGHWFRIVEGIPFLHPDHAIPLARKPVEDLVDHRGRPCTLHRDCGSHVWLKAEDAGIVGPFYWVRKEEVLRD